MNGFRGTDRLTKDLAQNFDAFLNYQTDLPASRPANPIPISRAGIRRQYVSLDVPSFVDSRETITIAGEAEAYSALPPEQRGVHMSRIVEALAATSGRSWRSVLTYIEAVLSEVAKRQQLGTATMEFIGRTTVGRLTPVTRRLSPDTFKIKLAGQYAAGRVSGSAAVGATVMTACPCTQAFSRYTLINSLAGTLGIEAANEIGFAIPTFTHSQRGQLWLDFDLDHGVDLFDAYKALESAAHLTFELLKRPDEHELVRRAHRRPQFTEDVVRDVVTAFVKTMRKTTDPSSVITASCQNLESIHGHDAYSEITISVAEASKQLGL